MKATQNSQLFADLSIKESQTVQGGNCRRYSSYRPYYYYYKPYTSSSYYPSYSYGYGYGGYGSYGSSGYGSYGGYSSGVNQTVNVNVRYDD